MDYYVTLTIYLYLLNLLFKATFYPIEAERKGATASQFGAVFGIIHLSLFMFGRLFGSFYIIC